MSFLLLAALAIASCRQMSGLASLIEGGGIRGIRGAALMDDSSLWDPERKIPSKDGIEERDWAFTALGDIDTARLAVKMDYFIDDAGSARPEGFSFLNRQLVFAKRYGLGVVIDMHVPPGGAVQDYRVTPESMAFWNDEALKDRFVRGWEEIARRYANDGRIIAFELMNEPSGPPEEYWKLMRRTVEAIRRHDSAHTIILQPDREWRVEPVGCDDVAYSFHFYDPLGFTHQGVEWDPLLRDVSGVRYPGEASDSDGKESFYDRARIRELMSYPARIARDYGVPVIIGEFGVSTAAEEDSAGRWLADVLGAADDLGLDGYIYWREIYEGSIDAAAPGHATMAAVDRGCYYSPARFMGVRPGFEKANPGFDGGRFYRNFGRPDDAVDPCAQ